MNKDDIKNRWKEYIEVLYDEGKPLKEILKMEKESEVDEDSKGPDLFMMI